MPDLLAVATFATILFVLSLTPGPAAAFCMAIGIEEHGRSAVWAPVGISLGKLVHLILAAAGATWINDLPAMVRNSILLAAGGYLIWQGYRHWAQQIALIHHHGSTRRVRAFHIARDGFLVAVANPESLASSVAVLTLFAGPETSRTGLAMLIGFGIGGVVAAYLLWESISVSLAHRLGGRSQNRIVGATYLAAAAGLGVIVLL